MTEFQCVKDCSQCCVEREYFPSKAFGKVGVLLLPTEKEAIKRLAEKAGIQINILPRIGISKPGASEPAEIIAYQMMGREPNGNTCPFLDTESDGRSEHGGLLCKIYGDRPLACSAYPLVEVDPVMLDKKCKFCKERNNDNNGDNNNITINGNLESEFESLLKIKTCFSVPDGAAIWRYATGVGEESDMGTIQTGWVRERGT